MNTTKPSRFGIREIVVLALIGSVIIAISGCSQQRGAREPVASSVPATEAPAPRDDRASGGDESFQSRWATPLPRSRHRESVPPSAQGEAAGPAQARAALATVPDGKIVGTIELRQIGDALQLDARLSKMPLGTHAVSIASTAACPTPGTGAGRSPLSPRAGAEMSRTDVGSLRVDVDGIARRTWTTRQASLSGPDNVLGRSIIVTPTGQGPVIGAEAAARGGARPRGAASRPTSRGEVVACGVIHPALR